MKLETVKVNGVVVNVGEEHLADKWAKDAKAKEEAESEPEIEETPKKKK